MIRLRDLVAIAGLSATLLGCQAGHAEDPAAEPPRAEPPPLLAVDGALAALPTGSDCNLETINLRRLEGGRTVMDGFSDYLVEGWVIDTAHRSLGDPVQLHVIRLADGAEWRTVAARRLPRPDVEAARGGWWQRAWVYANAGFQATIPRDALPPGRYRLGIEYRSGAQARACGLQAEFEVSP